MTLRVSQQRKSRMLACRDKLFCFFVLKVWHNLAIGDRDLMRHTTAKHADWAWIQQGCQHMDGEQVVRECSCGILSLCWVTGLSVINGRGRAPLIVAPDTGTRPQTKQDRAGAGCHAQSPSSRKPECCSGGFWGKRGHLVMTVEENSEETWVSNQLWDCLWFGHKAEAGINRRQIQKIE